MQTNNQHDDDDGSSAAAVLPDDMLANVFGRLPPSSLAASRCVRKHWCSIIDARRLLRVDLLPLQLDAIFCNPFDLETRPSFFAPPSTTRRITTGRLDFSDTLKERPYMWIMDQCNGLLLISRMVVNPATRQCASLPAFPSSGQGVSMAYGGGTTIPMWPAFYLVYDPMMSPQHFEVFLIPSFCTTSNDDGLVKPNYVERHHLDLEWPPSPYTTHVFSSRTWRWEERSFVRQGEVAAGTIADMMPSHHCQGRRQAVYFRGALYVHCQNDSVMRIALSNDKYQMIKPPAAGTKLGECPQSYLGKSEKGVYSVLIHQNGASFFPHCRVWLLNERCGHMEWLLKSNISLLENIPLHFDANKYSEPWTVDYEEKKAPAAQDGLSEWVFDDDIVSWQYAMVFLGFHPSKEIAFFCILSCKSSRAVSFYLNTSKVEELGPLHVSKLEGSFPYTACWMGELFENNS